MLERCDRCNQVGDKYLEFDNSLKAMSLILCYKQIYRHIYFNINYDKVRLDRKQHIHMCFFYTLLYLVLVNWYENCLLHNPERQSDFTI